MSCSSDDQSDKECPLCMEQLEIDDWNFYPCKCEYQICRFCWHRLRTDENGLCPACRQPYPEEPLNFKPLSTADMAKMKSEKKMKQQAEKQRISESRKHLASYRVLQKNLVYVVGLSARVADPEMLKKPEYFGKYGKITKVAVGTTTSGVVGSASHTAYVTYLRVEEALRAIQGVQNALVDGRIVKASLGTTKYCSSFLRSQSCYKPECMYLHDMADADISFTKEDMHAGKHADYEKRLMDTLLKTAAPPPVPQSIVPPQPLISSTLSSTLAAAAASKKKTEVNGIMKDPKLVEDERRVREKEEDKKLEEEFPPVSVAMPPCVPAPVPPTATTSVPSTPSTMKLNGKTKKSEEKSNGMTKVATAKKEKKEKAVIPTSPATRISRDLITLPRELSASPPDDWTSRDDGPSCSPPPGLPAPPHLVAANSSTTMTPPSESSVSPPRCEASSVSSVSAPQWQTLLGLAPRPISPPSNGFFSDDDLGFDPFHESSRELAALVEEEKKAVPHHAPTSFLPPPPALPPPPHLQHLQHHHHHQQHLHHQQQQLHHQHNGGYASYNSFGLDTMGSNHFSSLGGLSSLYSGGLNGLDSSPLDAFSFSSNGLGGGSSFPSLSSNSLSSRFTYLDMTSQSLSSRPSYDASSSFSSSSLFPPAPPPGLGLSAPPPPGLGPLRSMTGSGVGPAPGLPPPSSVPQGLSALAALRNTPPSICSTSSSTRAPLMSKAEWQEGFKSLLPNINVRFSAELERELR
ncbi:hypothetical protein PENTCL1PPCAC_17770 [Pristionchus entomophagus]|uniref:CCR4-NOT transcription complex subunit 4 n=1 Tax=Pristionchus entomophagus TaxID=358040 RepID=A0AAV5TMU4_9BILA|nr:hypothetical protein PENTCL1PPCAC_17770 [Pristionchus entomophagus]